LEADAGCCEKVTEAFCFVALGLGEEPVALLMARVLDRGGEDFVVFRVFFEKQGFLLNGVIEACADLVGFAVELERGHGGKIFLRGGLTSRRYCR